MQIHTPKCSKGVGVYLKCPYCNGFSIKYGKSKMQKQRYKCKECQKTYLLNYSKIAYIPDMNNKIVSYIKEGCGIRSIARLLHISCTTVLRRILYIAQNTNKPPVILNKTYEVDELCTYIGNKQNRKWLVYALCRENRQVVDFGIGNRTKNTLSKVISTLLLANAYKIYTDKLTIYQNLIPYSTHNTTLRATNHIERMNLTLRTHIKRLNRKTLCFSKSVIMLSACLSIYFWN